MKKILIALSTLAVLNSVPVFAQNEERIAEIEAQIKELQAELKELKGETNDELVIADDEQFIVKFIEIKEKENNESYEFIFEVENKTDLNVEVQARTVSIDDMMVDVSLLTMSQEVAPGKKAKTVLKVRDYSGDNEIPELTGNFVMDLHIFSWDDYEFTVDYPVVIELD
ncbi:hypothetical protein ACF3NG_02750 [Aerococcaceae bacterium WGS1372]